MNKVRIVIADDHILLRDGVKNLLQKEWGAEIVGEATTGVEAIDIILQEIPDIALLDLNMPIKNGIQVIREVREINPSIKCVILSMHEDPEYILKSVQAGAMSYLLKNANHEEIIYGLKQVYNGQKYFNSTVSEILIQGLSNQKTSDVSLENVLTQREKEVLKEVAEGLSTKMIAEKLIISTRTVETHRINIMKKLKAQNTAELIRIAMENKLI
ncbi:MAG: response regulator transcription factor [Cytophagaceae bacterium]|jgi:DNA-binding NarL/FixJ family response regulator|nr:response regulator transcription factor [Cytophagaceae bacterium]